MNNSKEDHLTENSSVQHISPRARQTEIVVQELPDETLVYDLRRHQAYCLNRTAALIWQACDGQKNVHQLAQLLAAEISAGMDEEAVWLALEQLGRSHLLEAKISRPPQAAKVSRRRILRQAGMAVTLALPLITSIVAPTAALAASCLPIRAACQPNSRACCGGRHAICGDRNACCIIPNGPCTANADCCLGDNCQGGVCVNIE